MPVEVERGRATATTAEAGTPRHRALRRLLMGLLAFSIVGTVVELILLDHLEDLSQQLPFYTIAVGAVAGAVMLLRPRAATVHAFRAVMAGFAVIGVVGVWLHYRGNVEFELEMYPSMEGLELFWKAMEGATPTLAPGLMVQLGLLGLAATHAHPALRRRAGRGSHEEDT